ncbi:MAG: hypothetical protein ACK55I_12345 [bacterium]
MKTWLRLLSSFAILQSSVSAQPTLLLIVAEDLGYGEVRCS